MNSETDNLRDSSSSKGWSIALAAVLMGGLALYVILAVNWERLPQSLTLTPAGWRGLLISFLFFTPLAAGMVVWPAIVVSSRGLWAGQTVRTALAAWAFAPVSVLMLAMLWIGNAQWAPWSADAPRLHQGAWLDPHFLFGRDLAALVVFWLLAWHFIRRRIVSRPGALAGVLIVVYCLAFSLIGFDLVMALDPQWYSALFGGYFFVSGVYLGAAGWTLSAAFSGIDVTKSRLHDLGKLIVTFGLLTTYMVYSQVIVIWYENLPHEVRFLTPRFQMGNWPYVGLGVLLVAYLGPLALLLTVKVKKSVPRLCTIAIIVLVAMWAERWYFVTPTLAGRMTLSLTELSLAAATAAGFALCIMSGLRRIPPVYYPQEAPQ